MSEYNKMCDLNNLYESWLKAKKGSIWKASVQKYELNLLSNLRNLQRDLINRTYEPAPFYEFILKKRGKNRWIKANTIRDRIVRHCLCDNILNPILDKYLIYDSGASRKGKGIDFTRKRLETHIHKFYREYGNNGYILLMDYSKFYDNINHEILINFIKTKIYDNDVIELVRKIINTFKIDVSYMTDEEYRNCYNIKFDIVKYEEEIDRKLRTGKKYMYKSIGIGDQISQTCSVFFLTQIDNYCKIIRSMKYYGRYMDDAYCISNDKELLKDLVNNLQKLSSSIGLELNMRKTRIVKLSTTFTFLKIRYQLTDSGKLIRKLSQENITRERRKLKSLRKFYDEGKISYKEIDEQFNSWIINYGKYLSWKTKENLNSLFLSLFSKEHNQLIKEKENKGKNYKRYRRYRKNYIINQIKNLSD